MEQSNDQVDVSVGRASADLRVGGTALLEWSVLVCLCVSSQGSRLQEHLSSQTRPSRFQAWDLIFLQICSSLQVIAIARKLCSRFIDPPHSQSITNPVRHLLTFSTPLTTALFSEQTPFCTDTFTMPSYLVGRCVFMKVPPPPLLAIPTSSNTDVFFLLNLSGYSTQSSVSPQG